MSGGEYLMWSMSNKVDVWCGGWRSGVVIVWCDQCPMWSMSVWSMSYNHRPWNVIYLPTYLIPTHLPTFFTQSLLGFQALQVYCGGASLRICWLLMMKGRVLLDRERERRKIKLLALLTPMSQTDLRED